MQADYSTYMRNAEMAGIADTLDPLGLFHTLPVAYSTQGGSVRIAAGSKVRAYLGLRYLLTTAASLSPPLAIFRDVYGNDTTALRSELEARGYRSVAAKSETSYAAETGLIVEATLGSDAGSLSSVTNELTEAASSSGFVVDYSNVRLDLIYAAPGTTGEREVKSNIPDPNSIFSQDPGTLLLFGGVILTGLVGLSFLRN